MNVPADFTNETIAGGLDEPLGMAFIRDGRLLVTEQRTGKVRFIVNGHLAATSTVLTVPNLNASGLERGLQGIAVDPGWPDRPYVYLLYNRIGNYLRLVRYTASGSLDDPNGESLTLGFPLLLLDNLPDVVQNHNGGTLRFGPDDHLYVSLGDDEDYCGAQDSTRLEGVVLRIQVTRLPTGGGGPVAKALLIPIKPALASPDSNAKLVYAYGVRNPWRFQIDSATGLIYLGDVGEADYEELNEVHAGDNLGWPFREGNMIRSPGSCSEPGGSGRAGYDPPMLSISHATGAQAILSAGVYRSVPGGPANWPATYYGDAFYSDYFTGYLRRLHPSGNSWVTAQPVPGQPSSSDWASGLPSPVDFAVGPDGSLWWLSQFNSSGASQSGSVQRIRFTGSLAAAPTKTAERMALGAAPNPFVAFTELSFAASRPARTRLLVFDSRGSRVRTLLDGGGRAGETHVVWDGMDGHGSPVSPGIYFARLERGTSSETIRILRLR